MNARIGLRLGGFTAAVACAFLVACGGGGGGSTVPSTSTTPTPTPAATPTIAPTAQATTASVGSSSTQVTLGGVSDGTTNKISSAAVTLPAVGTSTTASLSLTVAAPSGVSAPQGRLIKVKHKDALGVQTIIAYLALEFQSTVTISQSPAVTIQLPGAASGNWYLLFDDPSGALGTGWSEAGQFTVGTGGTTLTLPSATLSPAITLQGNQWYYFAIASTGANPIQTPTPTPSPTPTATPTGGSTATPNPAGTVVPGSGTPIAGPTYGPLTSGPGWGPRGVADQLDFPVQHGWDGTGIKVGIVIDSCVSASDWSTYFTYFSTPNSPTSRVSCVAVDGASLTPNADDLEAALDSETIASLASNATVTLYVIPSLASNYIDDAYAKAISDGDSIVNSSFGGCEYTGITADSTIAGGSANGVAFVASSGDQGNECYNASGGFSYGVNNPASDPNVIGVGGTETLRTANQLTSSTVWNDTSCNGACGGGGGFSTNLSIPTYQTTTNITSTAQSSTMRNVPDISLPAEDDAVFVEGAWQPVNGTSWAAPEAAALFAEIYQYCGVTAIANPANIPYIVFNHSQYGTGGAFIDVTSGNDQYNGTTPYFTAGTGYDNASGIGVPMGMAFTNTLCPGRSGIRTSARPVYASAAYMQHARPVDVTFNPPSYVGRLSDLGVRGETVTTPVQVLIRPTSSIASDEQAVIKTLRDAGFTITQTFPNHLVVDAQAPASTVNSFFRTQLHDLSQGHYGQRYAPMSQATIPASIAPYVSQVHLDNVVTRFVPLHR